MTQPFADARLPAAGDKLAGKYEIVRIIGEGGMGVVYEAMHLRLQQKVAIKLLQPRVLYMPDVVARFEREARAACRLRSRHAVRILDVDQTPAGLAYMVMEYLEGHDLSEELNRRIRLSVAESVDFVLQACVAMAEAHASGVVHRDLKPSNLFIVQEGARRVIKVLDFGISKMTTEGEAHVTSTFATMGTPLYMSPEQIRSAKNVDARTDIWSLGVILYELLVGERPFAGTTTAAAAAIVADEPVRLSVRIDLPPALEQVVLTALAKKPEDRYRDVRSFAEALEPFAPDGEPLKTMRAEAVSVVPRVAFTSRAPSTPSFAHAETLAQTPSQNHRGGHAGGAAGMTPSQAGGALGAIVSASGHSGEASSASSQPSSASLPRAAAAPISPVATTTAGWSTLPPNARRASRAKWGILAAVGGIVITGGLMLGWAKLHPADGPGPSASASGGSTASTATGSAASVMTATPVTSASPGIAAPSASAIGTSTVTGESGGNGHVAVVPIPDPLRNGALPHATHAGHATRPAKGQPAAPAASPTSPASPASPNAPAAPTGTNPLHL